MLPHRIVVPYPAYLSVCGIFSGVDSSTLAELEDLFRFNDAVLRNLTIRRDSADTGASLLSKERAEEKPSRRPAPAAPAAPAPAAE